MTKKIIIIINIFLIFIFFNCKQVEAFSIAKKMSGRILLDVERNGEAWYVNPVDLKRYYLGRPEDAFRVMRELGLGIKEIDFQYLAENSMPITGDLNLARKLSGRIILQVERNGEAWYVNPVDLKRYYLGRPEDAFRVMRELGLGITRKDLALIHKSEFEESINNYSKYERKKIEKNGVIFTIDMITIDLSNPQLEIITDTAPIENLASLKNLGQKKFPAKSLIDYVLLHEAFAGISGSYFCAGDGCSEINYFFYPVYNSRLEKMINEDQLKYWSTGPIIVFDSKNKFYYFKDVRDFVSVAHFESKYSTKVQAAISNRPRLIQDYMNYLIDWELDQKQMNIKTTRAAIGYKDNKIYLVVAYKTTISDLGDIMQLLGMEYALNLDGGRSTALYYNGEYITGPGRNIPNVILFKEKNIN